MHKNLVGGYYKGFLAVVVTLEDFNMETTSRDLLCFLDL